MKISLHLERSYTPSYANSPAQQTPRLNMVEYCVVVESPEDLFKLGMNSLDYNRSGLKAFLFPTTLNQNQ